MSRLTDKLMPLVLAFSLSPAGAGAQKPQPRPVQPQAQLQIKALGLCRTMSVVTTGGEFSDALMVCPNNAVQVQAVNQYLGIMAEKTGKTPAQLRLSFASSEDAIAAFGGHAMGEVKLDTQKLKQFAMELEKEGVGLDTVHLTNLSAADINKLSGTKGDLLSYPQNGSVVLPVEQLSTRPAAELARQLGKVVKDMEEQRRQNPPLRNLI